MCMVVDRVLTVNSTKNIYLDSCEPSVDSSQPETSTSAKTEEGSLAMVESSRKPEMPGKITWQL